MGVVRPAQSVPARCNGARWKKQNACSAFTAAISRVLRCLRWATGQTLPARLQTGSTLVLLGEFRRSARTVGHARALREYVSPRRHAETDPAAPRSRSRPEGRTGQ